MIDSILHLGALAMMCLIMLALTIKFWIAFSTTDATPPDGTPEKEPSRDSGSWERTSDGRWQWTTPTPEQSATRPSSLDHREIPSFVRLQPSLRRPWQEQVAELLELEEQRAGRPL